MRQSARWYSACLRGLMPFVMTLAVCMTFAAAPVRADDPSGLDAFPPDHPITLGDTVDLKAKYTSKAGDVPIRVGVHMVSPSGERDIPLGDSDRLSIHSGATIVIPFTPTQAGAYRYHFYATDTEGNIRAPEDSDLELDVRPQWLPWAEIAGGFVVCMVIIAALIYQLLHRACRVTQHPSARWSLMVGFVAWVGVILYALQHLSEPVLIGLAILEVVLILAGALFSDKQQ